MPPDPLTDIDDEMDEHDRLWPAGRYDQALKRLVVAAKALRLKGAALDGRADAAEARLTVLEARVTALEQARP